MTALPKSAADLAKPECKKIALAETKSVPAGIYAREYLEKIGLWNALKRESRPDRERPGGIGCRGVGKRGRGHCLQNRRADLKEGESSGRNLRCGRSEDLVPVGVMKSSKELERAKKLAEYLSGPLARQVFEKFAVHCREIRDAMTGEAWQIVFFTLRISALSTLLILPLGIAIAWLLARRDWPGKAVLETAG